MAAVPSIGRASQIQGVRPAPEADATHALYERYASQIFGYCMHQLGSREEAEDAVQSTFLNAFRGLSRGVVPELEQAWLFKIAHNVCLSRRRSSWRRGRIESPEDFQEMQDTLAAPNRRDMRDELVGLQDVLEGMPENQRRAILLREWQGLSYREIAEEMDLSQAAVETLIFRARRTLAQGLQEPPKKTWRKGASRGLDLGGVLSVVKTFFAGGAAVKVGAAMVAVTAATVAATTPPLLHHRLQPVNEPKTVAPVVTHVRHASTTPVLHVSTSVSHVSRVQRVQPTRVVHASAPVASHTRTAAPPVGEETVTSQPVSTPTTNTPPAPTANVEQPAQNQAPVAAPPTAHPSANAAADHGNAQGRDKHGADSAPPAPATGPTNHGQSQKPDKHGKDPRVPAVATPATDPAPQPTPTDTTTTVVAPTPAAPANNGNGNAGGNGNGRGHNK